MRSETNAQLADAVKRLALDMSSEEQAITNELVRRFEEGATSAPVAEVDQFASLDAFSLDISDWPNESPHSALLVTVTRAYVSGPNNYPVFRLEGDQTVVSKDLADLCGLTNTGDEITPFPRRMPRRVLLRDVDGQLRSLWLEAERQHEMYVYSKFEEHELVFASGDAEPHPADPALAEKIVVMVNGEEREALFSEMFTKSDLPIYALQGDLMLDAPAAVEEAA